MNEILAYHEGEIVYAREAVKQGMRGPYGAIVDLAAQVERLAAQVERLEAHNIELSQMLDDERARVKRRDAEISDRCADVERLTMENAALRKRVAAVRRASSYLIRDADQRG